MNIKASGKEKSGSNKWLFKIITLSIPLIFLLLIEGGLRLVSYGDNLSLFTENPIEGYEDYLIVNPIVGKKYFQKFEYSLPPNDIFLKKKAEGTFRIFVMGSSTVVGFPYSYNLMFSRILHKRLEETYPNKHIEVINTAITAVNSFTLRDFGRQIRKYEPDAVLIYAGHNEFYGAFGVGSNESMSKSRFLTRLHLYLIDFRVYQLIRNIASSTIGKIAAAKSEQVHGTLMKRIVGNSNIEYNSDEYKLALKNYEENMGDLIRWLSEDEIPVFLSNLVSNVKDIRPLSSVSTGTNDEAGKVFSKAAQAYNMADYDVAYELFYKAKDLDAVRFRASEDINQIILKLSEEYKTYAVPMLSSFQSHSSHNLIGNNLLTEHVHPNIDGSFLMADAFYSEIIKSEVAGNIEENEIHSTDYIKQNWGYTELDILLAYHRVANIKHYWPFVPINANIPDYLKTYRPVSKLDSIAIKAIRDPELSITDLRLDLAKSYSAAGNFPAAYYEYEAILYTNPYLAINYRDAAGILINLGDLPLALKYFKKSLEYEKSFYASYRMGEIYLIKADYENAISSFKQAFESAADDNDKIKILGKLYIAYSYIKLPKEAVAIAAKLKENNAGEYLSIPPENYSYYNYIPFKTSPQISTAKQFISERKLSEALSTLESSLKIYDSHIARELMGEIYLEMGENKMALTQFNRVYSEFCFDSQFLTKIIKLNIDLGEYDEAESQLKKLKTNDPNSGSTQMLTNMLLQAQQTN
ncbi:MAG: hypothetical protein K9H49_03930 [Bacteroidales bacterium]|nr:hypothetical protein [Bacteroidales bacterium]MCF8390060.1 hypothetical protein [Bacteroidales bacterium]